MEIIKTQRKKLTKFSNNNPFYVSSKAKVRSILAHKGNNDFCETYIVYCHVLIGSFSEFCMETKLHIYHPDFSRVSHLSSYCKLIKAAILRSCSITDNFVSDTLLFMQESQG